MKVCELARAPQSSHKSHKRPRESPSPNDVAKESRNWRKSPALKKPNLTRCLESEFTNAKPKPCSYETPTQKFFNKLERDKQMVKRNVAKKQQEVLDLETSFMRDEDSVKRPLCSNCHTAGHNKTMCSFAPCESATICKEIKRYPNEEKHHKTVQTEVKDAKLKLKKIELDIVAKKSSYSACANTFALEIQG